MLVGWMSKDLVAKGLDSVAWIRDVASPVKGGGGGRADMAQAGGKNPKGLTAALKQAVVAMTAKLG